MAKIKIHYAETVLCTEDVWTLVDGSGPPRLYGPEGTEYGPEDEIWLVSKISGKPYRAMAMSVARFMGEHVDSRQELDLVNRYLAQSARHPEPVSAHGRIDDLGAWLSNIRGGAPRVRNAEHL